MCKTFADGIEEGPAREVDAVPGIRPQVWKGFGRTRIEPSAYWARWRKYPEPYFVICSWFLSRFSNRRPHYALFGDRALTRQIFLITLARKMTRSHCHFNKGLWSLHLAVLGRAFNGKKHIRYRRPEDRQARAMENGQACGDFVEVYRNGILVSFLGLLKGRPSCRSAMGHFILVTAILKECGLSHVWLFDWCARPAGIAGKNTEVM